jgi:CRISPR-associated endonuclease Csn1
VIKRVKISGVNNAQPLSHGRNHFGQIVTAKNGDKIEASFVSTGNNHHAAIFLDQNGRYQEEVVSFYEAVERMRQGVPLINKSLNSDLGWKFLYTLKTNEMFVFPNDSIGFDPNEIDLLDPSNRRIISPNLFRVQKFATKDYVFRHHLETNVEDDNSTKDINWKRMGLSGLTGAVKVRVNHIGDIVQIGEY